jgi:hypothetical protein
MVQVNPRRLPEWRRDRIPMRLAEDLAPGTVIANGVTNKVLVAVLGVRLVRIRARVSVAAGTLKARYVRPVDHATEYTTGNPADVPMVAGTEVVMNIATVAGEAYLSVQITSGGAGMVVDYVDVAQLGARA